MTRMTRASVSRRQLLTGALATGASVGLFGASTVHTQAKDSPFVPVHGACTAAGAGDASPIV
jgi:hypothetical protein